MITCTHPGKLGDLLWALPTVRQIAYDNNGPVRLWLSPQCEPLVALLERQDYIDAVVIDQQWQVQDTAPATPRIPPARPDAYRHLGYPGWPTMPLPFYVAQAAGVTVNDWSPWIRVPASVTMDGIDQFLCTWTDRWFELKVGLMHLLGRECVAGLDVYYAPNSRWQNEWADRQCDDQIGMTRALTVEELAAEIATVRLVVTDCSMAHVLAAAMGKQVVVVEPETDRHHFIFWPGSIQREGRWHQANNEFGKLIHPVLGNDGKPTFDARHTADLIKELLR